MDDATRMAVPRLSLSLGLMLKSAMMLAMIRCFRSAALISSSIFAHLLRSMAFWKLFRPRVRCSNH